MLFFLNFLLRVGQELIRMIFFFVLLFSLFLGLPQHIFAWKEATIVFFNFFLNFLPFFLIFYYRSGRNSLERFFLFSLFLSLSQLILAWKDAVIVFFFSFLNFVNFFAIFFKIFYYESCRNSSERFFFYFLSFSAFFNQFWLEKKA